MINNMKKTRSWIITNKANDFPRLMENGRVMEQQTMSLGNIYASSGSKNEDNPAE